jgi:hypothetical protein
MPKKSQSCWVTFPTKNIISYCQTSKLKTKISPLQSNFQIKKPVSHSPPSTLTNQKIVVSIPQSYLQTVNTQYLPLTLLNSKFVSIILKSYLQIIKKITASLLSHTSKIKNSIRLPKSYIQNKPCWRWILNMSVKFTGLLYKFFIYM